MLSNKDYEKLCKRRKEVAKIIFENAFMTGLSKLKRSDLYDIICLYSIAYGSAIDNDYYEKDAKDVAFEDKCTLCELLDENFFSKN